MAVLYHRGVDQVALHGQVGRVVFRDSQGLHDSHRVKSHQVGGRRGAGHRSPGAVSLINRVLMPMLAAPKAMGDLIADNHGRQHSLSAKPKLLTQRQRCWKNLRALMS